MSSATYNFISNARFRFQCDASGNKDHVFIDEVIMRGSTVVSNLTPETPTYAKVKTDLEFIVIHPNKSLLWSRSSNSTTPEVELTPLDFSVSTPEKSSSILLFPNPARNYFSLSIQDDDEISSIHIFDSNDRLIKELHSTNSNHNISDLPTGIFVVKISTKNQSNQYLKLVKTE